MVQRIIKRETDFALALLSSDDVLARWGALRNFVQSAFTRASYNGSFQKGHPAEHTHDEIRADQPNRDTYRHLVAIEKMIAEPEFDESADLEQGCLGAIFSVPVMLPPDAKPEDRISCESGWFMTAYRLHGPGHKARKFAVANALINEHHRIMKEAGFGYAEVEMGTAQGAKYWTTNFGYKHEPVDASNPWVAVKHKDPNNRYTKEL